MFSTKKNHAYFFWSFVHIVPNIFSAYFALAPNADPTESIEVFAIRNDMHFSIFLSFSPFFPPQTKEKFQSEITNFQFKKITLRWVSKVLES